ncbi:MAG: MarR family winged helix-turn-helix transcriptional regulator [Sphingomonadales bacterium]
MSLKDMAKTINMEIVFSLEKIHRLLNSKKKGLAKKFGLTPGQVDVLRFVGSKDQKTVPHVARRLGVSRQNIQVIVNKLMKKELAFTITNPDHKLSSFIALTEKGVNVSVALSDHEREIFEKLFEGVNIGEKTLLLRVLNNIQ